MPVDTQHDQTDVFPTEPELTNAAPIQVESLEPVADEVTFPIIPEQTQRVEELEETSEVQSAPEIMEPVSLSPVLSEMSQSTAEPMPEEGSVMTAPSIAISENVDINVPLGVQAQSPVVSEFPAGIFQLEPAMPQTTEDVDFTSESEEPVDSTSFDPSLLADSVDVRVATETREGFGPLEGDAPQQDMTPGPLEFAAESAVTFQGGDSLESLGAASDIEDTVDVGTILREELGDGSVETDATEENGSPVGEEGPEQNLFIPEPSAPSDTKGFGPSPGPSDFEEGSLDSFISLEDDINVNRAPENQDQRNGMAEFIAPSVAPEEVLSNPEGETIDLFQSAPSHMMEMPTEEKIRQGPAMVDGSEFANNFNTPAYSDSGEIQDTPDMQSDISHMPIMTDGMPEMPHEVPEMTDDIVHPNVVTAGDIDANQFLAGTDPEMVPSEAVAHGRQPHSMSFDAPDDEHQPVMPSDIIPDVPTSDDVTSMVNDEMAVSEGSPFVQIDSNSEDQAEHEGGEPLFDFDFVSSEQQPQSFDATDAAFNSAEPVQNIPHSIPEGFGPVHPSSVLAEDEESVFAEDSTATATATANGVTYGEFQGVPGSEEDSTVEDQAEEMEGSQMTMSEGNESTFVGDIDVRGGFDGQFSPQQGEQDFGEAAEDSGTLQAEYQEEGDVSEADFATDVEADFGEDMEAQPTIDTVVPTNVIYRAPEEDVTSQDDSFVENMNAQDVNQHFSQDFYQPQEHQMAEDGPKAGSTVSDDIPSDESIVPEFTENIAQMPDIDIRIASEPMDEADEADIAGVMSPTTESEAEAVDVLSEEGVASVEEHEMNGMENIDTFEDQLQNQEVPENADVEEEEGNQEENFEEQHGPMEGQNTEEEGTEDNHEFQDQEAQEAEGDQDGDRSVDEELPTGYGPPHSETIVPSEVTEDGDVTAPTMDDVIPVEAYDVSEDLSGDEPDVPEQSSA
ncbi:uncharacterized protein LOC122393918 [Amphibalanus amphitrite]|uniref:uncharacterized protein LOC122393918 n=1 Tax=Amphibalanus amphitrite TaxID=1232801 RepID=UPI001C8FE88C|nr:uncharacterized protein LOC122393918 [Amphibalanus amphitrite]